MLLLSTTGNPDYTRRLAHLLDMDYSKTITVEPGKRSGKPCIRGMRITVYDVLEYLAGGIVRRIADIWPASAHVADHGLGNTDDVEIWNFARRNQFTIVTKDSDFRTQSVINGAPPRVIWLTIGN